MITFRAHRNSTGLLYRVSASGHAGWGEEGSDIICAAVSVLLQTLQGGLEDQLGCVTTTTVCDRNRGELDFSWLPQEGQQVLTEAILHSLALIARQEPQHMTYSEVS